MSLFEFQLFRQRSVEEFGGVVYVREADLESAKRAYELNGLGWNTEDDFDWEIDECCSETERIDVKYVEEIPDDGRDVHYGNLQLHKED